MALPSKRKINFRFLMSYQEVLFGYFGLRFTPNWTLLIASLFRTPLSQQHQQPPPLINKFSKVLFRNLFHSPCVLFFVCTRYCQYQNSLKKKVFLFFYFATFHFISTVYGALCILYTRWIRNFTIEFADRLYNSAFTRFWCELIGNSV